MKKTVSAVLGMLMLSTQAFAADKVPAYVIGAHQSAADVSSKLTANGFEVLSTFDVPGQSALHIVVATSPALKQMASADNRGFAAIVKVLVNDTKKEVKATNPIYFANAYMQDDFNAAEATKVADALNAALGSKPSTDADAVAADDLAGFHFSAPFMPEYDDFAEVAKGADADLLAKIKAKAGSNLLFALDVGNGRTLVGVNLTGDAKNFPETLAGWDKALVFPYTVMIEGGKAKIMHPKYYLALSYPQLGMGQFAKIMAVPGQIEDEFEELFK